MRGEKGVFHLTGCGEPGSWHDVARAIVGRRGVEVDVAPVSSGRLPRPAKRRAYSVMDYSGAERVLGADVGGVARSAGEHLAS
jgi:dTDP-4-dehydrorhamnose reductase